VYIRRVVLENCRGLRKLDFTFERADRSYAGWTVVVGDNASGKTALLKAIAGTLIGPDAIRSLQPSYRGWIRRGEKEAVMATELVAGERDRFQSGRRTEQPFWSELNLSDTSGPEVVLSSGRKLLKKGKGPMHGPWADNPEGWFSAGYGPFRRLYGASPEAQRVMSGPSRVARFATVFREDATLGECEMWLKELHHRKLESHAREERILENVLRLLDADFLENGLSIDRVDSDGLWLRQLNGVTLPLIDMSEGYRAALAMVIDILRHLVEVYGVAELVSADGPTQVSHPGVVLIDEVDAHLHPEWQRKIGFWFKKIFPNIQFIVTTHSPMICQAADNDSIYRLPAPGTERTPFQIRGDDYNQIIASPPNQILISQAFQLEEIRSPRAVEARRGYAQLKAKNAATTLSPQERQRMEQLELFACAGE
jgi:energy-coupling factor transporter ATP-binding protein EcfA2